jgi:hypothetical protein
MSVVGQPPSAMTHHAHINPHPNSRHLLERWLLEPKRPSQDALSVLDHVLSIVERVGPVVVGVLIAVAVVVLFGASLVIVLLTGRGW